MEVQVSSMYLFKAIHSVTGNHSSSIQYTSYYETHLAFDKVEIDEKTSVQYFSRPASIYFLYGYVHTFQ